MHTLAVIAAEADAEGLSTTQAVIFTLSLLGVAVLHATIWPYAPCRRCGGQSKVASPGDGKAWRNCRGCGGSGKRVRLLAIRKR